MELTVAHPWSSASSYLSIASIPFRVSTSLKPAQQLNRSLSRRSIFFTYIIV